MNKPLPDNSVKTDSPQNANIGSIIPQQPQQPLLLIKDREPKLITLKAVDWSIERLFRSLRFER